MIQLKLSTCNKNGSHNTNGVKPYRGLDAEHRLFLDWHRELGPSLPMTDLDCILCEYDYGQPVALIELKSSFWTPQFRTFNFEAMRNLATAARIPAFCVQCSHDHETFTVWSLNRLGYEVIGDKAVLSRDGSYEAFLHDLRKKARCR